LLHDYANGSDTNIFCSNSLVTKFRMSYWAKVYSYLSGSGAQLPAGQHGAVCCYDNDEHGEQSQQNLHHIDCRQLR